MRAKILHISGDYDPDNHSVMAQYMPDGTTWGQPDPFMGHWTYALWYINGTGRMSWRWISRPVAEKMIFKWRKQASL